MSIDSKQFDAPSLLEHGGALLAAATRYGIAREKWLDLSTGINPDAWPLPVFPAAIWSRLPEEDDGLEDAARAYYGSAHILPVAGSQASIQAIPRLRDKCRVGVLDPGYAEHAVAWRRAGHRVVPVCAHQINERVSEFDVLVLIHPNNPSGARFGRGTLLRWLQCLAARGGWLIVDEAFMDATPDDSLSQDCPREGLIVLRSLGKFFGLAGARVGFVCAQPKLLARIRVLLGPWTVSSPARLIARQALQDRLWQKAARERLSRQSLRLSSLLAQHGLKPDGGCALFQWLGTPRAAYLHEFFARRAILSRYFEDPPGLRFGLPGSDHEWERLERALSEIEPPCGTIDRTATLPNGQPEIQCASSS